MRDIQVVFVRSSAAPRDVRVQAVLSVPFTGTGTVVSVAINGYDVLFMVSADREILAVPPGNAGLSQSGWIISCVIEDTDGQRVETFGTEQVAVLAPSLRVTVESTSAIAYVRVNGTRTAFTVIDGTTLLCEMPKVGSGETDVQVVYSSNTRGGSAFFDFGLNKPMSTVKGKEKTVAQFIKLLLSTPETDAYHPNEGGGLLRLISGPGFGSQSEAAAEVMRAVSSTASQMATAQATRRVPISERLLDAAVLGVTLDESDTTSIGVDLRLITADGLTIDFSLVGSSQNGGVLVG